MCLSSRKLLAPYLHLTCHLRHSVNQRSLPWQACVECSTKYLTIFIIATGQLETRAFQVAHPSSSTETSLIEPVGSLRIRFRHFIAIVITIASFVFYQALLEIYRSVDQSFLIRAIYPIINMRLQLQLLLVALGVGLSMAQT